jgi:hypothetical protein
MCRETTPSRDLARFVQFLSARVPTVTLEEAVVVPDGVGASYRSASTLTFELGHLLDATGRLPVGRGRWRAVAPIRT